MAILSQKNRCGRGNGVIVCTVVYKTAVFYFDIYSGRSPINNSHSSTSEGSTKCSVNIDNLTIFIECSRIEVITKHGAIYKDVFAMPYLKA